MHRRARGEFDMVRPMPIASALLKRDVAADDGKGKWGY